MKKIDLDMERCCACGACAIACMDQNNIEPAEGMRPFRTVFRDDWEEDGKAQYFSIACMHCDNAPCVLACPVGCIYKDVQTGYTLFDNTNCIGCHSCAMACPFGAPAFGKDGKMRKCNGCIERVHAGLEPACVRACAFGALQVVEEGEIDEKASLQSMCKKLAAVQR